MRNRTGKPVRREDFFDRRSEVAELWHLVARDNVLMLAPRRVGKTSVLLKMKDEPKEGWRCVYLTVESVESEARFVARLLAHLYPLHPDGALWVRLGRQVKEILERLGKVDAGPIELNLTSAIGRDWQEVGDAVFRLLEGTHGRTLLMIDEFPIFVRRLLHQDNGIERTRLMLDWFRETRIHPSVDDADVHFLIAGSVGLDAVTTRVQMSGTISDLEVFRLGPLDADMAEHLLLALGAGEGIELGPDVRRRILERINWSIPYHLQLLFSELYRSVRFRGQALTPDLVDVAYDALLTPSNRKHFAHWEERLKDPLASPAERDLIFRLLSAAALDPSGVGPSTVRQLRMEAAPDLDEEAVLLALESDGYVTRHGGRWRFASSLLRDWWLAWKVREA